MKIEYSLTDNPREHHTVEDVVSYTYTANECLIFSRFGLVIILKENEIEDFAVSITENNE